MSNLAIDTVKNIGEDLKGAAEDIVTRSSERAYDAPKSPTVDKDYAIRTAAEHNDIPTIKSVVGVKSKPKKMASYEHGTDYVPKTGPAVLHEGERVVPKEKNMATGVMDAIKNIKDTITSTAKEYSGLGNEYAGKADQMKNGPTTPTPKAAAPVPKPDSGKRYGDRPGEKRLDSEGNEIPKYHKGTSYVPKTGPAILEKGEAVIPKDKNMDATAAMEGITGKPKPKKEIKEMVHTKTHNNKHIVTHRHHHPEHHPDETHAFDNMADVHSHMEDHAGMPNEGEAAPTASAAPAPLTAAPSPTPVVPGM